MSNRLPRALLADIAAVIGSGDHASALMMLGDESGPEASAAALTILPPADAPVTPTLEVISPELTAVRLRRMLAAVFMKAGRELDAEMELALLPVEARSL